MWKRSCRTPLYPNQISPAGHQIPKHIRQWEQWQLRLRFLLGYASHITAESNLDLAPWLASPKKYLATRIKHVLAIAILQLLQFESVVTDCTPKRSCWSIYCFIILCQRQPYSLPFPNFIHIQTIFAAILGTIWHMHVMMISRKRGNDIAFVSAPVSLIFASMLLENNLLCRKTHLLQL